MAKEWIFNSGGSRRSFRLIRILPPEPQAARAPVSGFYTGN